MQRLFLALREAGLRFSRDGCAFMAQAVAFNALFALFPLLVLLLSGASLVVPNARTSALGFFDQVLPTLHDFIAGNLDSYIYGRGISSIIALGFLVWSGKNLFMGLAYALDRALGVPKGRSFVHSVAVSIAIIPLVGILLVLAMSLPVVISVALAFAHIQYGAFGTLGIAYVAAMVLVFTGAMLMYRLLPNRHMSWGFTLPGSALNALLFPLLQLAFSQYVTRVDFSHVYGALSVPLVLLLWFYVVGIVFFYGAEFSAAWAALKGSAEVPALIDTIGGEMEVPAVEQAS